MFCNVPVNREENHDEGASAEHAIPLSKGGMDSNDNLLLACRQCNHTRGSLSLIVFLKQKNKVHNKNLKRYL